MQARANGWATEIFAVEVGARGYCANSTLYALRRLGFSGKRCREIGKTLADIAMKASFSIYLSRETQAWDENMELIGKSPSSSPDPSPPSPKRIQPDSFQPFSSLPLPTLVEPQVLDRSRITPTRRPCNPGALSTMLENKCRAPIGFHNKGNSCYANAILQALSATPEFWSCMTVSNSKKSKVVSTFLRIMCEAQTGTAAIDPFYFLEAF